MDFFQTITKRQSYRGRFKKQPVSREDLIKIVSAGLKAPSGKNAQTTTFVIIDDTDLVSRITAINSANTAVQTANAFIACIINRVPEPIYEGKAFEIEDCAAAVENMLLAVTALGYSSVWVDGWLRVQGRGEKISRLLNLPASKIVRVLLPVGIADEQYPQPEKLPFDKRTWFNSYDNH